MNKQGSLFDLNEPKDDAEGRGDVTHSFPGFCSFCGEDGEVWQCKYCHRVFCEDCGSKKKRFCEYCVMYYGSVGEVRLPPNADGLG